MYEIRPESVKAFITDRNIRLPRFQRKQTWDNKKNFQLCISLFKEYPIGVTILSVDENKGKVVRWLLDGRQRKNALTQMYDDPENIYTWARDFIGFKNNDQPFEIEDMFNQKISEYIEAEYDEDIDQAVSEAEDFSEGIDSDEDPEITNSAYGLALLLDIIKIIHNKNKRCTGFTKPFDFIKYVDKLPYVDKSQDGATQIIVSKQVKSFIDQYRKYCDDKGLDYEKEESFFDLINDRCVVKNEAKLKEAISKQWNNIKERILIVERIDNLLSDARIGVIEVKNLSPSDSQKIFNIINSEGEKLTAVEILSAKPHWNIPISNPSQNTVDAVNRLYQEIGVSQTEVVRWDLPATLIKRLGNNIVFKEFGKSKTDFEKELTIGFKVMSGIFVGGVKKESIEELSKVNNFDWNTEVEPFLSDLTQILKIIEDFSYFKFLKSWKASIQDLTSDAVTLDFICLAYNDWKRKGKPLGTATKKFQKNCFILLDKLIYEHANKQWRGASDQKIANNISALDKEPEVFTPISEQRWKALLTDIFKNNTVAEADISQANMKPLLYHFYCLSGIQGPDSKYDLEVDHIIPKALFDASTIDRKEIIQHNLLNLGLLPKGDNGSKSDKKLIEIDDEWLKSQIEKYEFIKEDDFVKYSNINHYKDMFKQREKIFFEAYVQKRNNILNN